MASTTPRRSPIPRPWLAERRYMHAIPPPGSQHALHPNHPHHDYRYLPPPLGASAYPYSMAAARGDPSMELLPRPNSKVSWSKLSCCFCPKSHQNKEIGGAGTNSNPSASKLNGQDLYRRRSHNDNGAFHGFPIVRRHSSNSLMLNENEIYPVRWECKFHRDEGICNQQGENPVHSDNRCLFVNTEQRIRVEFYRQ